MVASSEGGMNIEDVAKKNPDSIIKDPVDITTGSLSLSRSTFSIFLQHLIFFLPLSASYFPFLFSLSFFLEINYIIPYSFRHV